MPNEHVARLGVYYRTGAQIDDARNVDFTSGAGLSSTNVSGALDELATNAAAATNNITGLQTDVTRLERRTFAWAMTATPRASGNTTNIALALVYPDGTAATPSVQAELHLYRTGGQAHSGCAFTSSFGGTGIAFIIGGNNAGTSGVALLTLASGHGTVSLTEVTGGDVVVTATVTKTGTGAQIGGLTRYVSTTV